MAAAPADSNVQRTDLANRRLAAGLAASLLLHGMLLSLQFGLPGRAMGELRRFTVSLAPRAPDPVEPAPPAISVTETPAPLPPAPSGNSSAQGMRLVDIAPPTPSKPLAQPRKRVPARRISRERPHPQPHVLRERVIASQQQNDSFAVQQPEPEEASQKTNDPLALQEGAEAGTSAGTGQAPDAAAPEQARLKLAAQEDEHKRAAEEAVRQAERDRVAAQLRTDEELARRLEDERRQREAEQQRQLAAEEDQRLAAEARTRRQDEERQAALAREQEQQRAEQALARQMEEQRRAAQVLARQEEEQRVKEALAREQERLAADALARQQEEQRRMAEASALQREQQRLAAQAQERRAAEELARQQALQREVERRTAQERAAQELLERQRREAGIRQAEQAERELAARREEQLRQAELRRREQERLAAQQEAERQRLADEAARRQAEQLAQQRQTQALARQQEALSERQRAAWAAPAGDFGQGQGAGAANGTVPRGALGSDLADRARELVRGIGVLGGTPPVARAPEEDRQRRRMVSNGAERDVPLRMYIDSFRQKIERNGTLNGGQQAADRVRVDPLVSVAIRADGSVEEVLILRSSGRAELDEAVRRIVRLNARYAVFPPNVAAQYDVIEIRRIWTFANGLKLLEELR